MTRFRASRASDGIAVGDIPTSDRPLLTACWNRSGLSGERGAARRRRDATDRDSGSVVAEWAMVAGVTAVLFAVTLQVIFALHVRNVLIDAASHGARYGTLADRDAGDAVERTNQLITETVGGRFAGNVSAQPASVEGVQTLEVTVVAPLPIVGPFGPPAMLEVSGHAVETS